MPRVTVLSPADVSPRPTAPPAFPTTLAARTAFQRTGGLRCTSFQWRLYDLLLTIPPGRVATYGQLAKLLNSSPRAVGSALRNNPFAPYVPCHRVIASSLYIGGFGGEWIPVGSHSAAPTSTSKSARATAKLNVFRLGSASSAIRAQAAAPARKPQDDSESAAAEEKPAGRRTAEKVELLRREGVHFGPKGFLEDKAALWDGQEQPRASTTT